MSKTALQSAEFIVSETQLALDSEMLPCDLWGTRSHVIMLAKSGIIPQSSAGFILAALDQVERAFKDGSFRIDPARGAQLSLEAAVIERTGVEDGSRMHTARSRNDQVMVTELIYLRERALALYSTTLNVAAGLVDLATAHVNTVMPGYTHMQPAKPTTFGQWALAHAEGVLRCLGHIRHTWDEFDACPLGAVESYGTSWPIDRRMTAALLGFSRVWEVPQDAISSRGMAQLGYLDVCKRLGITISKIATDLLLFTTWEYGYVNLGDAVAQRLHPITGSSVMAQKRNPDALELLRATGQELIGLASTAAHLLASLPMGYNRDSRELKEWSALGFNKTHAALSTLQLTLSTLQVNQTRMLEAVRANYSSTTDLADMIARLNGIGYRRVYSVVGKLVDRLIEEGRPLYSVSAAEIISAAANAGLQVDLTDEQVQQALDPALAIAARTHIGGPAAASMGQMLAARHDALSSCAAWADEKRREIEAARARTAQLSEAIQAAGFPRSCDALPVMPETPGFGDM